MYLNGKVVVRRQETNDHMICVVVFILRALQSALLPYMEGAITGCREPAPGSDGNI